MILGEDELAAQQVALKPLRGDAPQEKVDFAALAARLDEILPLAGSGRGN